MAAPFTMLDTPKRFHGGVGFRAFAASALDNPTRLLQAGAQSVYPLKQHRGEATQACVKPGERVLAGQRIAKATSDPKSAHVFAGCSGTVTEITAWPTRFGEPAKAIVIRNEPDASFQYLPQLNDLSPATLFKRIEEAGIVGLGGARFPTAAKVELAQQQDISHLILNGIECEPYITCDQGLMRESPDLILEGARLLQIATNAKTVVLAVREDMQQAVNSLQSAIARCSQPITLVTLPNQYPQGSERQLIEALSGQRLAPQQRPVEIGVIVNNVATAAAVAEAVAGKPMMHRRLTVCGDAVTTSCNVDVPLGMLLKDVLQALEIDIPAAHELIIGGPLSGYVAPNLNVPITKGTQAVLLNHAKPDAQPKQQPCIRCGECVQVCPELLNPALLWQAQLDGDQDTLQTEQLEACIECGCCDWVCPSALPLTQGFHLAKTQQAAITRQAEKAEHFRQRHEQRLERQAREAAESPTLAVVNRGQSPDVVIADILRDDEGDSTS